MASPPKIRGLLFRTKRRADGTVRVLGYYYQPPTTRGQPRPKEIALGTADYTEALLAVGRLLTVEMSASRSVLLSDALERAIERKLDERVYRDKTARDARNTARALVRHVGERAAESLTRDDLEDYQRHLHRRLAATSVLHHMATLSGLFATMVSMRILTVNPIAGVRLRRARTTRREKFCSREERDRLIETCTRDDLRFILHAGFHAGLRIGEIVNARPSWFHLESGGGFLTVQSDGDFLVKSQARSVPMTREFRAFLDDYGLREPFMLRPDKLPGKGILRYDCKKPFSRHVTAQGLGWVTPHIMRHTFASLHAIAGRSATKVARWLGITVAVFDSHYAGLRDVDEEINL